MNVAWRIEFGGEGVMQVGEGNIVLTHMEFKGKCHSCGKHRHEENKCPKKNKPEEEKGYKKFSGKCNHCGKVGTNLQTAGNMKRIKIRGPRIGRRKKTQR